MQSEERVALQGARARFRAKSRERGERPGMDYRRSEISKRDLECQQGAEGTGLCALGKASTLSLSLFFSLLRRAKMTARYIEGRDGSFQARLSLPTRGELLPVHDEENFYLPTMIYV